MMQVVLLIVGIIFGWLLGSLISFVMLVTDEHNGWIDGGKDNDGTSTYLDFLDSSLRYSWMNVLILPWCAIKYRWNNKILPSSIEKLRDKLDTPINPKDD